MSWLPVACGGRVQRVLIAQYAAVAEGSAVAIYVQGYGLAHGAGGIFEGNVFGREIVGLHQHRLVRVGIVADRISGVVAARDDGA